MSKIKPSKLKVWRVRIVRKLYDLEKKRLKTNKYLLNIVKRIFVCCSHRSTTRTQNIGTEKVLYWDCFKFS